MRCFLQSAVWPINPAFSRNLKPPASAGGVFIFSEHTESSYSARLVPHEPVIQQTIVIHVGGKEYLAWKYTKHNYSQQGEFPGKKLNLHCDLNNSEEYRLVDAKAKLGFLGICRLIDD